jgi:hypothetical protein
MYTSPTTLHLHPTGTTSVPLPDQPAPLPTDAPATDFPSLEIHPHTAALDQLDFYSDLVFQPVSHSVATDLPTPSPANLAALGERLGSAPNFNTVRALATRLRQFGETAGFDMDERYPETRFYLEHPEQAGSADTVGQRALGFSSIVAALEKLAATDGRITPADRALLERIGTTLGFLVMPDLTPRLLASAPRRLLETTDRRAAEVMEELARSQLPAQTANATTLAMENYFANYHGRHEKLRLLLATLPLPLLQCLAGSMHIYGTADPGVRNRLVFERDLVNHGGVNRYQHVNPSILGCERSFFSSDEARQRGIHAPGNPTSHEMRAAIFSPSGNISYPRMLNLAAVALDTVRQPEYRFYADRHGKLRSDAYSTQMRALLNHVDAAVQREKPDRVVLSALGTGNFLNALPEADRVAARGIVRKLLVEKTLALRSQGIDVTYCEKDAATPFWAGVNVDLIAAGSTPVTWVGGLPGEWMRDGDLILNASDNSALTGNDCVHDRTFEGFMGAWSSAHPMHAFLCFSHNYQEPLVAASS